MTSLVGLNLSGWSQMQSEAAKFMQLFQVTLCSQKMLVFGLSFFFYYTIYLIFGVLCCNSKTIICYDCNVHVVMPLKRFNLNNSCIR